MVLIIFSQAPSLFCHGVEAHLDRAQPNCAADPLTPTLATISSSFFLSPYTLWGLASSIWQNTSQISCFPKFNSFSSDAACSRLIWLISRDKVAVVVFQKLIDSIWKNDRFYLVFQLVLHYVKLMVFVLPVFQNVFLIFFRSGKSPPPVRIR